MAENAESSEDLKKKNDELITKIADEAGDIEGVPEAYIELAEKWASKNIFGEG